MCTTFYGKYWYKYLCNICLKLQRAVAAKNHMCLKILIRISWEYLFENINMNILGIFVWKYQYEYLGNICLKLNYSERWPRRLKRLERRGQRRSRSFVSPSRFFLFLLFLPRGFSFSFCLYLFCLFIFCICNLIICYICQTRENGQRRSRLFLSLTIFYFFFSFVIFNVCLFLCFLLLCLYLQHYCLFFLNAFPYLFFLSIYLYLQHHHLFKLESPGKRRSRSQVWDNRWYLKEITKYVANKERNTKQRTKNKA